MTVDVISILYCNGTITIFTLRIFGISEVIDNNVFRLGIRFCIWGRSIGKEVLREPTCLDVVQSFEIEQRTITFGLILKVAIDSRHFVLNLFCIALYGRYAMRVTIRACEVNCRHVPMWMVGDIDVDGR